MHELMDNENPQLRSRAQMAHDDSKSFLASVVDTLQDSVVTINLDGIITSWNPSAERVYGYRAAEAIGKSLNMVMVGDDFNQLLTTIETIKHGEDVALYQTVRVGKDGQRLHLEITLSPVKDKTGGVIGVSTVARDITELQKAQQDVADSESRLRAILEAAVDFGIITLDGNGLIIDWNRGAENIFGYTKSEIIGRNTEILFTPEDRHAGIPQVEMETARVSGRAMDERWHLHRDGTRFFMSGVTTVTNDAGGQRYVKVARNITDRKLAEEALLMSEQRKSLAVQSAEMGEWEWELATGQVKISNQVSVLFGIADGQRDISTRVLKEMMYPDDQAALRAQLSAALGGLNIFQCECRVLRADNKQLRWVNVYGRVVAHVDGKPSKMLGVLYDITPRKHLEKQRDDFISMASHELKTPLTAIKTYSELLQDSLEKSCTQSDLSLLMKMNSQVDRLVTLMQNLLDSSQLSESGMKLYPQTFDLNAALEEHFEALKTIAVRHRLTWNASPVPLIHADPVRIVQVIDNFVSNAVKYSPEGSEIIITTEDKLDHAKVSVRDQGMGIPLEAQQYVFERYYRGEHTAKGFGLGLYICAQIVRQHHGEMGLSSSPGQGSTFYFNLPYS